MALTKKANTYYAYFRDLDGRQIKRSLHTGDYEIAVVRERAMKEMIKEIKFKAMCAQFYPDKPQITTAFPKRTAPAPGEHQRGGIALAKMWQLALTRRDLSKRHKLEWQRFVNAMKTQNLKYADQITAKVALTYLEQKYGSKAGKTYNNNKTALHTIFRLCLVEAGMQESPFAPIANRRITSVEHHRALTEAEFIRAFQAAAEPWKTAALISWHTALRRETCFRLAWAHINTEDHSITIIPGKTARFGRAVYIPIHPQLWEWLCALPKPEDLTQPILSQFPKRLKWSGDQNKTYFVGLLKSLGIGDTADGKASFHSIRASFITRCDEAGISRRATQGVAGQRTDDITDLYSHDKETAKQILKLPSLDW